MQDLIKIIIEWINDELVDERIIIQDIEEDLYDGQVGEFLSFFSGFFFNWEMTVGEINEK